LANDYAEDSGECQPHKAQGLAFGSFVFVSLESATDDSGNGGGYGQYEGAPDGYDEQLALVFCGIKGFEN
jgi:hypothetical protein